MPLCTDLVVELARLLQCPHANRRRAAQPQHGEASHDRRRHDELQIQPLNGDRSRLRIAVG